MKRDVKITTFGGHVSTATIINDRDSLRVENMCPSYEKADFFIRQFLSNCIDIDEWRHSQHISVTNAQQRGSSERKEIQVILDQKIEARLSEIEALKDAKIILSRWDYKLNQ